MSIKHENYDPLSPLKSEFGEMPNLPVCEIHHLLAGKIKLMAYCTSWEIPDLSVPNIPNLITSLRNTWLPSLRPDITGLSIWKYLTYQFEQYLICKFDIDVPDLPIWKYLTYQFEKFLQPIPHRKDGQQQVTPCPCPFSLTLLPEPSQWNGWGQNLKEIQNNLIMINI